MVREFMVEYRAYLAVILAGLFFVALAVVDLLIGHKRVREWAKKNLSHD